MNAEIYQRFYHVLQSTPGELPVVDFISGLRQDPEKYQAWKDFLIEQYLSDALSPAWSAYTESFPDFDALVVFHRDVQNGIKRVAHSALRTEAEKHLPRVEVFATGRKRRSRLWLYGIAAAVLIGGAGLWLLTRDEQDVEDVPLLVKEVPVLMIEPFSGFGDMETLIGQGISQGIPAKLSMAEGIIPISARAVSESIRRTGSASVTDMGATYHMQGSVTQVDGNVRIEASLIRTQGDSALWEKSYAFNYSALEFDDVQDAMSVDITHALRVNLSEREKSRLTHEVTSDPRALELYLYGERQWAERTDSSLREAIRVFAMAAELDSMSSHIRGYLALAHATLADAYDMEESWDTAVAEANTALARDPENPEALLAIGYFEEAKRKNYVEAKRLFELASKIKPGDARIHQALSELFIRTGEMESGYAHIFKARKIEPENRVIRWLETKYLTAFGRLEDARRAADELLQMYPDFPYIQNFYWQYYMSREEYTAAMQAIPKDRPVSARMYMKGLTYLEQSQFDSLHILYEGSRMPESFVFLEHAQKDEWAEAYTELKAMLKDDSFDLLAVMQTSDFQMFNKLKDNSGIRAILAKHRIKVHMIPGAATEI